MSAPYNSILQKCEEAIAALLTENGCPYPVFGGVASTTKPSPCVVTYAESAAETFPASGNYRVRLKVSVKSPMDPDGDGASVAAHGAACAFVFDWCKDTMLAVDLTSAAGVAGIADFCVQGAVDKGLSAGITNEGDSCIDSIELELYACASDLGSNG